MIEDGQTPCLSLVGLRKGSKPEQHPLDAELAIVQRRINRANRRAIRAGLLASEEGDRPANAIHLTCREALIRQPASF